VIGAASSLAAYGETMTDADRRQLVDAIRSESERLDRYIQNLLDMTRLGSGPLGLERDWVGLEEIVAAARERLSHLAPGTPVEVEIQAGLPALYAHPALIEQALFNVLENAAKFSPAGEPIRLRARRTGERLILEVVDRGPGIPPAERERIFDLFYSGTGSDGTSARSVAGCGSGLGLTIVRGMIGAHGGSVEALAGDGGAGTTIRISLPLVEPPSPEKEES
jgi:two-component system sensor histidine kinase KdpD